MGDKKEWTTCSVCHRVIWVEDGPVCCFCVTVEDKQKPKAAKHEEKEKEEECES